MSSSFQPERAELNPDSHLPPSLQIQRPEGFRDRMATRVNGRGASAQTTTQDDTPITKGVVAGGGLGKPPAAAFSVRICLP